MLKIVFVLVEPVEPLGRLIAIVGLTLGIVVGMSRAKAYVAREGRHIAEAYVVPRTILVYLSIVTRSDTLQADIVLRP